MFISMRRRQHVTRHFSTPVYLLFCRFLHKYAALLVFWGNFEIILRTKWAKMSHTF